MKVTQNPKTGKLIVDGEDETIYTTRAIPGQDSVELVTGFNIRPEVVLYRFNTKGEAQEISKTRFWPSEKAKPPKVAGMALSITR